MKSKTNKQTLLDEIKEQPKILHEIFKKRIKSGELVFPELAKLKKIKYIKLIGCGTSYHAALLGQYYFEEFSKIDSETEIANELRHKKTVINKNTLVIAISQSGTTKDTIEAVKNVRKLGATVLSIVNKKSSPLTHLADINIPNDAGIEKSVASTKVFSTQIILLLLLAMYLGKKNDSLSYQKFSKIRNELKLLPTKLTGFLADEKAVKQLAKHNKKTDDVIILGKKYNYPIALEGTLKLKEIAYLHAEGFAMGEVRHGPIAMIDKNYLAILILPPDALFKKNLTVLDEILGRGCKCIVLTSRHSIHRVHTHKNITKIFLPSTLPTLFPIFTISFLQLLAYHTAKQKNINTNSPRAITKSITKD